MARQQEQLPLLEGAIEDGGLDAERIALSMARRSAQRGERARAAELLVFAYQCADHNSMGGLKLLNRGLERELQEALPPEVYAAAQERGRTRDMEGTLRELLGELEQDT